MRADENEHSLEMQYPFLARVFGKRLREVKIVPVLLGSMRADEHKIIAEMLDFMFKDPRTLFVISSDFTHWGQKFQFTPVGNGQGKVYEYIESLDKDAMELIESLDADAFYQFVRKTGVTICGRHPIHVLLRLVQLHERDTRFDVRFLDYKQSSKAEHRDDSSVSYAAGVLFASTDQD
eukprot:TRINITY_DN6903_c0_g1_i1.p4 TRINITY_DN6903_c0_g1~~TRINITY_DN6903_c0_g1_i1.p4  ORF type:complete len:178 (-),score=87.72 TRINITY_DN6903_c0_g1_i1:39-572(-)